MTNKDRHATSNTSARLPSFPIQSLQRLFRQAGLPTARQDTR
jgi:hypothetical protein